MRWNFFRGIMIILLITPLLAGCWNHEELTDLALVTAVGVDKAKNNQGYQLTYEIVNPGNVAASTMGGGQGAPVAVYKSTGKTFLEASRKASKELSRHMYYAHTRAVIVSDEVAREGVLNLLDFIERDPVFRTTSQLYISKKAKAENVVSTLTILDKIPANKLIKSLNVTEEMLGENTTISIDDFINSLVSNGKEPIANGVELPGNMRKGRNLSNIASDMPDVIIKNDGIGIFKKGKLIGWVDGEKAKGVVWVLNKIMGTDIHVDWQGKKKALGIIVRRSKTKVDVSFKNKKPVINVAIHVEGDLDEVNKAIDLSNPVLITKVEKEMNREIEKEVSQSIRFIQKKKSDIFGFGEAVHRADPKSWRILKSNWNERFSTLEFSVHVHSYIRRNGIITKSFWSSFNQ